MLKHLILAVSLVSPLPLLAQEATGDKSGDTGMAMGAMTGDMGPASMAFMDANTKMHQNMTMEFTGNADVDFIKGMIPHHQGAVEMAKIVLQYGKDPEVRKLAEGIIAAQESEIKWMTEWLTKNGG